MKKLDLGTITMGLDTLKDAFEQNTGIGWSELVDVSAIDFAEKNSYAADDTDETIRDLADQIEVAGLLTPLGVIKEGTRYRLFSGERRYKAITTYLHWEKSPVRFLRGQPQQGPADAPHGQWCQRIQPGQKVGAV